MINILWLINKPISGSFGTPENSFSGSWLDAAFGSCDAIPEIELNVLTFGKNSAFKSESRGRHHLYQIPQKGNSKTRATFLERLSNICSPDIVQVWGTESDEAETVLNVFKHIPSIIYIQGVMTAVAEGYDAELSFSTKLFNITPRDIIHRNWIDASQRKYYKRAKKEAKLLNRVTAAIIENTWCEDQIHSIAPQCICYHSYLPIKQSFYSKHWNLSTIERYSIFTNACSMPLKGHHMLLKAFSIIVAKYPTAKLYIPGSPINVKQAGFNMQTSGYNWYLSKLIKKYHLERNIEYVGVLSDLQMAEMLSKVHVYVMPSCVENHSSSLIEALMVNVPCVSSFVGGTNSVAKDGINALLYNFPDYTSLAGHVCRIFESDELAMTLSSNAKKYCSQRPNNIGQEFLEIYQKILTKQ